MDQIFRSDAELNAFLVDHFQDIYLNASAFSDRLTRVNMLLEKNDEESITTILLQYYSSRLQNLEDPVFNDPKKTSKSLHVSGLRKKLDDLLLLKNAKNKLNMPDIESVKLDAEILSVRREIRHGPQLSERDVLGNRFSLMQLIGKGAAATVWQAYDINIGQIIAVKVLHSVLADDLTMIERFYRGARRMRELSHPSIVKIIEPATEEDGWYYFTMPYLAGGNLYDALLSDRISIQKGLETLVEISHAVDHAHRFMFIHRDIKPQNILLDDQGHGYLCDFDLMIGHSDTMLTQFGVPRGTHGFAAPEMLHGSPNIDYRADIFSLAMTAIFIITKHQWSPLFPSEIRQIVENFGLDLGLRKILLDAISPNPNNRPNSANELCIEILSRYQKHANKIHSEFLRCLHQRVLQLDQPLRVRHNFLNILRQRELSLKKAALEAELFAMSHDISDEFAASDLKVLRNQLIRRFPEVLDSSMLYHVGDIVIHKTFGQGRVQAVLPGGYPALVRVAFDKAGTKILSSIYIKRIQS